MGNELTPTGFEDAPLGIGESREVRGRELVEEAFDLVEPLGDLGGGAAQGRGARLVDLGLSATRIAHERFARGGVDRRAVGNQERLGFAGRKRVAGDRLGQPHLLGLPEGA